MVFSSSCVITYERESALYRMECEIKSEFCYKLGTEIREKLRQNVKLIGTYCGTVEKSKCKKQSKSIDSYVKLGTFT